MYLRTLCRIKIEYEDLIKMLRKIKSLLAVKFSVLNFASKCFELFLEKVKLFRAEVFQGFPNSAFGIQAAEEEFVKPYSSGALIQSAPLSKVLIDQVFARLGPVGDGRDECCVLCQSFLLCRVGDAAACLTLLGIVPLTYRI